MSVVRVVYDHRVDGEDLITHEKEVRLHRELCEIMDAYPWAAEIDGFEKYGVGGCFHFLLGKDNVYACYQYVPVDVHSGILNLDIVMKPGFLNIFGRKSVSKDFDIVSIPEVKAAVKELFEHTVESLYEKYRR
ncbi:hypothetical protein [Vibrio cholerae]|uniref:hypothetical protein n=1 Tax=Vibrio cholerae TaxID=666 RepID=UPI00301959DC